MPPVALFLCGQRSTLTAKVTRGYDKRVEWKPVQTFQATALVDEAYLRLVNVACANHFLNEIHFGQLSSRFNRARQARA